MGTTRVGLVLALLCGIAGVAAGQSTTRVSVAGVNNQVSGASDYPACSADGRFVAFESTAANLVAGDTNGRLDVFVRDRQAQTTERVSVSTAGVEGDWNSQEASISADGRYVAFTSYATTLVAGDTNAFRDIFVHDRLTHVTTRVSRSTEGVQANGFSEYPQISGDGRFVVFQSSALNLDPPDIGFSDIFIHDRLMGTTRHVSLNSAGGLASGASIVPAINSDGRFVAFESYSTNFEAGDTNGYPDVFIRDRETGLTSLVSRTSDGGFPNSASYRPAISADGRYVAFESVATNLVPNDTNAVRDIFVRDRELGTTTRVSVSTGGDQANAQCYGATISANGQFVVFYSIASNLIEGDTNGGTDVYLHDRLSGETSRVSVSTSGGQSNGVSYHAAITGQGADVVFQSGASNLIAGDTNNAPDIFARWIGLAQYFVASVSVAPSSLPGGASSTGTVTLTQAAPTGGAAVFLFSSNSSLVTVPYYIVISAGSLSGTFPIATYSVTTTTAVTIFASGNSNSASTTLTVRAPAPLSVVPASPSIVGGNPTTGTVYLDSLAGAGGVNVRMTDNSPFILMSTYCVVGSGQTSGNFNIWTYGVSTNSPGTISAYANGVTKTCVLTILPAGFQLFWVSPTAVIGGNPSGGNARLDGKAPSGGVLVTLSSSDTSAAAMSPTTTIAYGSNTKNFPISSFGVDLTKNVTITAVALGITKTATLQVRPAALLGITLLENTIQGGSSTIATVTLTGKTGPLGRTISLNSNNPKVIVPATLYVPPQKVSWTFTVQTQTVAANATYTITATQGAVVKTVDITLTP
ncbi:MAG: PD40 domain-containing protein [Methanoregulaceae archaeon]|nr:PD40 domain-containing protein [Methanoregulaceae archaeon]